MGKDNVRKLKNFEGKKSSKKYSKSKKSKRDPTTSDEMREILNSETEVPNQNTFTSKNNKGLVPYEGDLPLSRMPNMGMGMDMNMNHGGMGMGMDMNHGGMGMGMQQMFTPGSVDPLMVQQMAPLQTVQAMQQSGMPSNLMSPSGMMGNMGGMPHMGGMGGMPMGGMGGMPMGGMPAMGGMGGMPMTGGGRNKINLPYKRNILTRTIL